MEAFFCGNTEQYQGSTIRVTPYQALWLGRFHDNTRGCILLSKSILMASQLSLPYIPYVRSSFTSSSNVSSSFRGLGENNRCIWAPVGGVSKTWNAQTVRTLSTRSPLHRVCGVWKKNWFGSKNGIHSVPLVRRKPSFFLKSISYALLYSCTIKEFDGIMGEY